MMINNREQQMIDAINRYRAGDIPVPIWSRSGGRGIVDLPRVSRSWQIDERLYWKVWHRTSRQDPRQRVKSGAMPKFVSELDEDADRAISSRMPSSVKKVLDQFG
jgi:hypothetical protein